MDATAIVRWYEAHARDLPWREPDTSAYGVLVSEVMSQQTPVARVVPAWREWMRRWPDAAALAQAAPAQVLLVWGRLGYPRRALRLVEAARAVVERHGGVLPRDRELLLALPGVGEYTADAILAFAYGERALPLDTNVRRVLARVARGMALPPPHLSRGERERAWALLPPLTGPVDPAHWVVAVMELGALVCTARVPACERCPWRESCAWLKAGCPADEHASRRRIQPWEGTDRQCRGRVMARLRQAGEGVSVSHADLLDAAGHRSPSATARQREEASNSGGVLEGPRGGREAENDERQQSQRVLAGLLADGLIATDDDGCTYRLP